MPGAPHAPLALGITNLARSRLEEFAYPVEPALRPRVVRTRILRVDRLKLAQQLFLPRGQLHRRFDRDMAEEVAIATAAYAFDALSPQSKDLSCLRFRGDLDFGVAVQRRDLDFAAHGRGRKTDRHLAVKIVVLALEDRMLLQVHDHIEVAVRAPVQSCLAFTRESDAIVTIDSGRNLDRQGLALSDAARAAAGRAWLGHDLATAVTLRTRLLDREKNLRDAHLPLAVARRTGFGLRSRFGAAAMARRTLLHRRNADLGFGAARCFFERQFEIVAKVGASEDAAAATAGTALAAENFAEDVTEGVGKTAEALRAAAEASRTRGAKAGRRIDAGVPELVVGGALASVGEDLVRFLRLLEFVFRALVVGIAVRMMLHRQLAISLLDVIFGRIAIDAECRIVVALSHSQYPQLRYPNDAPLTAFGRVKGRA